MQKVMTYCDRCAGDMTKEEALMGVRLPMPDASPLPVTISAYPSEDSREEDLCYSCQLDVLELAIKKYRKKNPRRD